MRERVDRERETEEEKQSSGQWWLGHREEEITEVPRHEMPKMGQSFGRSASWLLGESKASAAQPILQRQATTENSDIHPDLRRPNPTELPDCLKNGIENLSGYDLSRVRVNDDSAKAAQLNAHAYTQGQTIEVGSGQERHLPHEAWHRVQQLQGRVRPTIEVKGYGVNDDRGLESEAAVMGQKAIQMRSRAILQQGKASVGTDGSKTATDCTGMSGEDVAITYGGQLNADQVRDPIQLAPAISLDTNGQWKIDGREDWDSGVNEEAIKKHFSQVKAKDATAADDSLFLTGSLLEAGYDNCHTYSWDQLRASILGVLNGTIGFQTESLSSIINAILNVDSCTYINKAALAYNEIMETKGKGQQPSTSTVRTLTFNLFNASGNLNLGKARINRRIGKNLDPKVKIVNGYYEFDEVTKMALNSGQEMSISNGKILCSQIGGEIDPKRLTDESKEYALLNHKL